MLHKRIVLSVLLVAGVGVSGLPAYATPWLQTEQSGSVSGSFSDVPANSPDANAIAFVQAKGIVSGYPDGTFRPNDPINRAEFVKIIVFAYADVGDTQECDPSSINHFSDADSTAWYSSPLCVAVQKGYIGGYPDGTFRPAANIQFAEAAKIIARADTGGLLTQTDEFLPWYAPYAQYLSSHRAVPVNIATFDQTVTRGDMAEMIYRLKGEVHDGQSDTVRCSTYTSSFSPLLPTSTAGMSPGAIRDLTRHNDVEHIMQGISEYELDHGGALPPGIPTESPGEICRWATGFACTDSDLHGVDLVGLLGYPIFPPADPLLSLTYGGTKYYVMRLGDKHVEVFANGEDPKGMQNITISDTGCGLMPPAEPGL